MPLFFVLGEGEVRFFYLAKELWNQGAPQNLTKLGEKTLSANFAKLHCDSYEMLAISHMNSKQISLSFKFACYHEAQKLGKMLAIKLGKVKIKLLFH